MEPETPTSKETSPAEEVRTVQGTERAGSKSTVAKIGRVLARCLLSGLKKVLYVVFIVAAVGLIFLGLDKAAELALRKSVMGDVYPRDISMARRDFAQPVSHYDYDLVPGVCIMYNVSKGNRYEYANNAGFREPRPTLLEKPDDEFRVFLTGGSTTFGLGATGPAAGATGFYALEYRETVSYMMERILNASAPIPGKTIRVYNTGVWGYSYQHVLLRYITKLRRYKPDLVVSLDGANDILPVCAPSEDWDYFSQGQFNRILRQIFNYDGPGLSSYGTLWLKNNTFLMTFFWTGADIFQTMEARFRAHGQEAHSDLAAPPASMKALRKRYRAIDENVSTVVRIVEDYHSVLDNDGVPHIVAVQPLLYLSKKPRHEIEQKAEAFGEHSLYHGVPANGVYKLMIDRISESSRQKGYTLADLSGYFDDTSEWVFTDWCHLTAGANYLIAKELSNLVKERILKRPLSEGDRIGDKESYFRNPTAAASVVYAPPPDDPENGPQNMLAAFPGPGLYSSKAVAPNDRLEVVLDLGREFDLSRLRLVWDEEPAIPEQWSVAISLDGESWTPWIKGAKSDLDNFSQWPGFEYYGAEPVRARYLRYKPEQTADRSISLRSWSVSR